MRRLLATAANEFAEKYTQSDFIAIAEIIKVYKNEGPEMFYKSGITIRSSYKGTKTNSIHIKGSSDGKGKKNMRAL